MVWLHVDFNQPQNCTWNGHDPSSNCAYLLELVNAVKSQGKNPGIYTSSSNWQQVMGSKGGCPTVGNQKLWYAHNDGNPSFLDFVPFGGWTKPAIKQYIDAGSLCGVGVNMNYYPWFYIVIINDQAIYCFALFLPLPGNIQSHVVQPDNKFSRDITDIYGQSELLRQADESDH